MPKLEIITGDYAQHQFLVEKVGVWIGSDERCDLRLEEPGISRFHAQILSDSQGNYWLEDAGSSFGTLLNGQDVERANLTDGDVITLGRIKLRYHVDPLPHASASPSYPQTQHSYAEPHTPPFSPDIEEDVDILDGDELELIDEPDDQADDIEDDDQDDYPVDTEGTRLVPMPLSPSAFFSSPPATPAVAVSAPVVAVASPRVVAPPPPPPPSSSPSEIDESADEDEMDLHGPPPPPRSRTVLFNLELERLKYELQQREKQLVQLQVDAETQNQDVNQQEWMKQTLEMVQEDNKRLQYQISAYEEAAEENEQLILQVEKLLQDNKRLYHDNKRLRDQLAEYENYFYQQQAQRGSHS